MTQEILAGQKWVSKTDPSKIATVKWVNSVGYMNYDAPWYKNPWAGCKVETFLKRFKPL